MSDKRVDFSDFIAECGYDLTKFQSMRPEERQVVNVARAAWNCRQFEIDAIEARITRFKSSYEALTDED